MRRAIGWKALDLAGTALGQPWWTWLRTGVWMTLAALRGVWRTLNNQLRTGTDKGNLTV